MSNSKMNPMMPIMLILILAAVAFVVHGMIMHSQVRVEEMKYNALQEQYYSQSKSMRDSAATGSELNQQLVMIKQYPSQLMQLKLLGVGSILTGIFIMLFSILIALISMPYKMSAIMMHRK